MTSCTGAVESATFDRLDASVTLAAVYQDVPDNTPPPVVILGDLSWDPLTGDPDDPDGRVGVIIKTVTDGDERAPCIEIQQEIEAALRGYRIDHAGWQLAFRVLGSDAQLTDDALGYVGTTTIEVLALSLD